MTKEQVISYYESQAHEDEVRSILEKAKQIIEKRVSLKDCAIIIDIDETALNHYYPLKKAGFPQDDNHIIWHQLTSSTKVMPIKSTLDFYHYCLDRGLKVFL